MGDSGVHLTSQGQRDSNGNDEDDDNDPSSTLTMMTMTQCHHHRHHHQLLYLKEPAIVGLPRCRSCCMMGDSGAHLTSQQQGASNGNDDNNDDDNPSTALTMTSAPVLEGTHICGSPEMQELLHDGGQWHAPHIADMPSRPSSSWVSASVAQLRPVPPPAITTHIPADSSSYGASNGVSSNSASSSVPTLMTNQIVKRSRGMGS
jgi:hypothetical protein